MPPNANGAAADWIAGEPNMLLEEAVDCWVLNEKLVGATFCVFVGFALLLLLLLPPNAKAELPPVDGCCAAATPPNDSEVPPKLGITVCGV